MNRPFPRLEVLGLTAALALSGACTPNTSVKPGAPVIIELSVVENGGASITTVTPKTGYCPAPGSEGGPCDPVADAVCQSTTTTNLCRCIANPAPTPPVDAGSSDAATSDAAAATSDAGKPDGSAAASDSGTQADGGSDAAPAMLNGTLNCTFAPTSSVLYVFDRVLDTEFLGDGGGAPGLATLSSDPTAPTTVALNGDYASNGTFNIIFTDPNQLGDFRADGPSILFTPVPGLPAGSTVTVSLDKTKVLAKDGRTPFTGMNLLVDGKLTFATQAFSAVLAPPTVVDSDAAVKIQAPDMTPATVTFTNTVDPTELAKHLTITAVPPVPVPVDIASMDGLTVTITPKTTWPASSTIEITLDATTPDVVGDTLGAAVVLNSSFITGAM